MAIKTKGCLDEKLIILNHTDKDIKIHPQSIPQLKRYRRIKKGNGIAFVNMKKYGLNEVLFLHLFKNHEIVHKVGDVH